MDKHSPIQRSKNMAAIKSTETKTEKLLRKSLWKLGYRYRKNDKSVFGKPDIVFKRLKIAIFVDSEFFHGKDFETRKKPMTNTDFWNNKISRNIERDKEVNNYLTKQGWTILRFWSKDVAKNLNEIISEIEKKYFLKS